MSEDLNGSISSIKKDRFSIFMVDSHDSIKRGGSIQCVNLAISLSESGHRVHCVFVKPSKNNYEERFDILKNRGISISFYSLVNPVSLFILRQKILRDKPDIIHTHKDMALLAVFFAVFGKKDFLWVANRGTVYSLKLNPLSYYVHRRFVDKIIAVSYAVKEALVNDGIDESKIEVVYGSFDPNIFHPGIDGLRMRKLWGIPENAKLVGLVGSFESNKKGQEIFLQAAKLVLETHPSTYFVLIGDGNDKKLRKLANCLDIEENVRFPGFYSNIQDAMAALDLLVCASLRGEGLTGTLREAMAMEIPVVSTDVAGNREIVHNNETGLLIPPGDPKALSLAICYLLENPEKAKMMAKKARELVYELCTKDRRKAAIERIYRDMLYISKKTQKDNTR
jgi:glycosyltransferase involved in cell wall biosynthesis